MNNNNNENNIVYLRIDDIIPNRFQPREVFDETGLEELADSIREHGVIQPIIVRQMGDKYELIAGERRTKASSIAGLTTIPAIIRNMDDRESAKVSLLENLQRKNLSAIEEARTYKRILELDNMTQDDLAKTMGKSQPLIANKLRLLSLPEEIQDALIKNQISERHARSLLNVKDKRIQLQLLDRIRNERLTVRELDVEIKKINQVPANDTTDESATANVYSNLNQPFSNSPFVNDNTNRTNYSNMGLNDYQSSINNNLYNNIPNYQQLNSQIQPAKSMSNDYDYNNFDQNFSSMNDSNDTYMNLENNQMNNEFNNMSNISNNYSSLGSMFDGQTNNMNQEFNENKEDNIDTQNMFISHIKEDELKTKDNQFLPNFDDMEPVNNDFTNSFLNNGFEINNYNNDYDNSNPYNQENNFSQDTFNNMNYNNDNFNYNETNLGNDNYDYNNMNQENNDFNYNMNSQDNHSLNEQKYVENQGQLFNQPLNFVDVPNQNSYTNQENNYVEEKYLENNNSFDDTSSANFDNPLDDPYENILFAKPVPILKDEKNLSEESSEEEVVVIGDDEISQSESKEEVENSPKTQYINLDPVQTIFDAKGAVYELKKTTDSIKQNNIQMETEEIDYDDYYQIVIKIKKD